MTSDVWRRWRLVKSPSNRESWDQSPEPGSAEKYSLNLFARPSNSLASGGGSLLLVIFGQDFAYSALSLSQKAKSGSVSGLIASAGHSGSHTPQSMHSSG